MTPRQIAVAVVMHEGRVLVGRRSDDAAEQPGCAEFPGGKIEPHETPAEAALRECLEEAGIAIRMLDRTCEVAAPDARPPVWISFHWAMPLYPSAEPKPPFEWVPISELSRLNFPTANATVLAMLRCENTAAPHGGS